MSIFRDETHKRVAKKFAGAHVENVFGKARMDNIEDRTNGSRKLVVWADQERAFQCF
jgi:hypothetical protein